VITPEELNAKRCEIKEEKKENKKKLKYKIFYSLDLSHPK